MVTTPTQKIPRILLNQALQDLALRIALHCVRNTILEKYHAQGKLSDPEMMAFNKEVMNKLYSFLQITHNPTYAREKEYMMRLLYKPDQWDEPKFDKQFRQVLKKAKQSMKSKSKPPS